MLKPILLILGAGGHGRSVAESAKLSDKWSDIIFADDSWPIHSSVAEYEIVCDIQGLDTLEIDNLFAIAAVGNNQRREQWHSRLAALNIAQASIIHPHAIISPTARIGQGVAIMAGCVVGTNTNIADGVILNIGTLIDHDVSVEKYAHLSVGVKVAGGKDITEYSFLEVGSIIAH